MDVIENYELDGRLVCCSPFGSGHINETFLLVTSRPHLYILQKVNTETFPDPVGLMNNIIRVTDHIRKKEKDPRKVFTLVPTRDGRKYILGENRLLWRLSEFVTGSICLNRAEMGADFRSSGVAFGNFQRQLEDFPAKELVEVIPGFHDTPRRYGAFHRALREDRKGRAGEIRKEIDFYLEREKGAALMTEMLARGELPLRVTHNDTKLNNVMLDEKTREPLCVIDLDTVMPGLAGNDFGDAIRFGASTADEDEKDLSRVHLSLELYQAFAQGFLSACGGSLTPLERETLPEAARLMTLECGLRFLTDYLEGDTYFHIARPEHNLDRARTQMVLVEEMEKHRADTERIIREAGSSLQAGTAPLR